MGFSRFGWTAWALVPVAALAFHYGPGQRTYRHDLAVDLQKEAAELEREAAELQQGAYAKHLTALESRRKVLVLGTPEATAQSQRATEEETQAFAASSAAWKAAAESFGRVQEAAQGSSPETLRRIRWSRSRALVRAGDIWTGIAELEAILSEAEDAGGAETAMATATREELGSAYYYGARLMRLSGEPAEEWLVDSGKARQHFRYLAERARVKGAPGAQSHEHNVELVLNLEQQGQHELEGKPLPEDSPGSRTGNRPGRGQGKRKQPPQQRDARGAGGAEDIYTGW